VAIGQLREARFGALSLGFVETLEPDPVNLHIDPRRDTPYRF
jgi:hypothetical protein